MSADKRSPHTDAYQIEKPNYEIITDEKEFNKFLDWLPDLGPDEKYYSCLIARNKYVKDLGIGTLSSDKHQCARFATTKERLELKLRQLESPLGSYAVKGKEVPQEALALYLCPNPRSERKAARTLLKRLADVVADNEPSPNVYQESLTALHQSVSRKIFFDVDFDGVDLCETVKEVSKMINPDACTVLKTRGGFHLLIRLELIQQQFVKSWYKNITGLPGADNTGDALIPVPGSYQGGFIPTMYPLESFK